MTNDYGNLELHKVLLSAMKDFDSFCKEHHLRYILHGGTCLGAIRHKGFIPWDDDVDIAMPRKDYEKFLKLSPNFSSEKYTILTYKTDPKMLTNVIKISINHAGFSGVSGANGNGEAFLDIFPLSPIPNSKFLQKLQNKTAIFLNNCVYAKIGYITLSSWKSKLILGTLSQLPRKFLGNMLEFCIKYFPGRKTKFLNIVATANYNNYTGYAWDLTPKEYLEDIVFTDFEGESFPVTKYWDEYLATHYGDYMQEPPIEKRINKHNLHRKEDFK